MAYVRNAWYVAAWTHDIARERPLGLRIVNEPIVIWRGAGGGLAAFEDRCIHRLAPLSLGRCEGESLRCMYHGLLYDRTGRVVDIPGQNKIPGALRLRTYPVVERHGWIWVWMGDASAADEALIPPVIGLDDPNYIRGHGQLDYSAEAFLVNENLLDLSHVSFLHAESFHMSETYARQLPQFTKRERGVRTDRWVRSEPRGKHLKPGELVDRYHRTDFYVPGVMVGTERAYPIGTADALTGNEPDLVRPAFYVSTHAVTPMTDRSTRYFFCVGYHRDYGDEGVSERDSFMEMAGKGFSEDKVMIEAQQRTIDITPRRRFTSIMSDGGVTLFKKIVASLLAKESPDASTSSQASTPLRAEVEL